MHTVLFLKQFFFCWFFFVGFLNTKFVLLQCVTKSNPKCRWVLYKNSKRTIFYFFIYFFNKKEVGLLLLSQAFQHF